jgi:hypothetical protein
MQGRTGGGTGGGSLPLEGNMDPNPLSRFNPYLGMNVTSFNKGGKADYKRDRALMELARPGYMDRVDSFLQSPEGVRAKATSGMSHMPIQMPANWGLPNPYASYYDKGGKLTPKEMKKVQNLGRFGDTQLAHVNPQEAAMLKAMGGSGTINPYTGLREYGWFSNFVSGIMDPVSNILGTVTDFLDPVADPLFDAAGNVVDPALNLTTNVVQTLGDEIVSPAIEGIASGSRALLEKVGEAGDKLTRGVFDPVHHVVSNVLDLFDSDGNPIQPGGYTTKQLEDPSREPEVRGEGAEQSGLKLSPQSKLAQLQKDKRSKLQEGDWVGDKPNPYIAENIEEELDYAAQGMKMPRYNQGGFYERAANQAIAENQLSALTANLFNRANNMDMAYKGMKMKKRYTQGGRF